MPPLICPVCSRPLVDEGTSLVCAGRHTFDRAREGYVDLVPQGYGRANIGGDTADMVAARRRFLAAGHYAPLMDAMIAAMRAHGAAHAFASRDDGPLVLDVGCGEGYYGASVASALRREHGACRLYGLDISRAALKLAARTHRDATFFRNDIATRICMADATVDVLLDVFAPRNAGEFARVLRPGGLAIVVIPEETHLQELRVAVPLLSVPPGKREHIVSQFSPHLAVREDSPVHYTMALPPAALRDLVAMSPSAHHVDVAQLESPGELTVSASFRVLGFTRAH